MIIKKYKLFLEASLKDLLKLSGNSDSELANQIKQASVEEFNINDKLPTEIMLRYNKKLRIDWYDTAKHGIVKRLKERTSFTSVEHFVEFITEIFNVVFPDKCGKELFKTGRYSIYSQERNISLILEFDLNKNKGVNYFINIITVLPGRKGDNVVSIIDIDNDVNNYRELKQKLSQLGDQDLEY